MACRHGVDNGSMDEALFEFFKKQKIKELKSKLSASVLMDIKNQKGVCVGDFDSAHNDFGFKSRLQSAFGCSMNDKLCRVFDLLGEICHTFDKYCTSIPMKQKEVYENMIFEILKLVVDGSTIHNHHLSTPIHPSKRKVDLTDIPAPAIANRHMKKLFCPQNENNVVGRVLFQSAGKHGDNTSAQAKNFEANASFVKLSNPKFDNQNSKSFINLELDEENLIHKAEKSPEVLFLKENSLKHKLNKMCSGADELYNVNFVNVQGSTPIPNANKIDGKGRNNDMNQGSCNLSFVSEGFYNKLFATGVGGAEYPEKSSKFRVTPQEKKNYNAVCLLANSRFSKSVVVDIGGCTLKYFSLGDSMAPGHEVCTFVINCMCRKFFLDERPTISLKHYFFSSVSIVFMSDSKDYSYVERCFIGAGSVLPLPLCQMLLFPVLHGDHWFLFVVDLSNKLFLFLDSLFSKTDEFSCYTRKKLIVSFVHAWSLFVGSDPGFNKFRIAYPHVPKQRNKVDCGIFLIKFMETWKFGGNLHEQFSQEDIPNIRIQIVNDLLMSEHNKADWDVVRNYDGSGTFTGTRK